jgi:type I restriction enzyme S subunit
MTKYPNGWRISTIGEVAEIVRGVTYSKADTLSENDNDAVPLLRATNLEVDSIVFEDMVYVPKRVVKAQQYLKLNDIFLAASSGSITVVGKSAQVVKTNGETFGAFCAVIRPKEIHPKFLSYWVQSPEIRDHWSATAKGTNINNLKPSDISETKIPIPPIDEQHQIVELLENHLSRLDAALSDVRQTKIKAAQFRRSILKAAFSGHLTSRGTVSVTSLPEDWAHSSIGNMCGSVSKMDPINLGRDSFKYVDIGSLEPSSSSLENIEAIPTKDAPGRARQLLAIGDSIFATVRPYMKKVAYISQEFDGEIASTGFCVLRPIEEKLQAKYLFYFLLSDDLLDQVLPLQRGVSYPAIRDNDLRNAFIPLPPITEQQRIVAILEDYFSRMEATTKIADDMEKQAAALRRSLLQAAFTGQLTKEVVSV